MKRLIWDDINREHIKKHGVTVKEVNEAYLNKKLVSLSYLRRIKILGTTNKGRLLAIIISQNYCVVTARDMSRKERTKYYEKFKTD